MRIGVIGHGMMGERHIGILRGLGLSVDAVMGRDYDRVATFAHNNNIAFATTKMEDFISRGIDVIHVCTPPENHYEVVKMALEADMSVICEKPFVIDPCQGEELIKLSKKTITGVAFNNRFHSAIERAKKRIGEHEIGEPLIIHGSYLQEFHALPSSFSWRYISKEGGPMLATSEIGSHWIDLLRYITGVEIKEVSASFGKFFNQRKLDDGKMYPLSHEGGDKITVDSDNAAIVTFRLSNGGLANAVFSELTPGRPNYIEINVTGSSGALWWNSEQFTDLVIGKKFSPRITDVSGYATDTSLASRKMIQEFYRDVSQKKRSEDSHYATFEDGLANAKICQAIYRSANNNSKWEVVV